MSEKFKIFLAYGLIGLIKNKQFPSPEEEKRKVRNALIFWFVAGAILLIALSLLFIVSIIPYQCSDIECFMTKSNQCESAHYAETTDLGTIDYYAGSGAGDSCVLTKQMTELSPNEDSFLKKVLEGKQMECIYFKDKFNGQWLTSMIEGLDNCDGNLKDAVGQLLILVDVE
jgi:hypothetical protein